jgi:hypothetical protein
MSVHAKLTEFMADRDVDAYLNLLDENFTVVFHKSGNSFGKEEWASMVKEMMANDKFIQESTRCIYENSEIMVAHSFMSYPDNSREAVMLVAMLKEGKIIHMETGATTLD